jgi:hypothetical protein
MNYIFKYAALPIDSLSGSSVAVSVNRVDCIVWLTDKSKRHSSVGSRSSTV